MTTKKFSMVPEPLNVEIHKTDFSSTSTLKKSKKKEGFKIACLLFF
jgi:hypothetical protein